ncbi:MAG: mannitol-1-phosphate 5-dehydrogenase [Eubacteriaceae bacterium]|nr:mannitol-1-phosphate 5-dehydrogenase [Eubacteriaceae bacterium]
MKKAIHFGAGNIGRGFIGLLLSQSGYEVAFADINSEIITRMNEKKSYTVLIAGKDNEEIRVAGISGILSSSEEELIAALIQADIITTAVGVNILPVIAMSIKKAIEKMYQMKSEKKVNIMACENAVNNTGILKEAILKDMPEALREYTVKHFGFPNTTVDRIVPETIKKEGRDILAVVVEPFYEWNAERNGFIGEIPDIKGMNLVDDLPAYIERKLFTLNTGHAMTAYLGYRKGYTYVHEAVGDDEIRQVVKGAMTEVGNALVRKHGFDSAEHTKYIEKILKRFDNEVLMDPVARVGRDPIRKLGPADRLIAPALLVLEYGEIPVNLILGITAALKFENKMDEKSVRLSEMISEEGISQVLKKVCGLNEGEKLYTLILGEFNKG